MAREVPVDWRADGLSNQGNLECARILLEVGRANAHTQGKSTKSSPLHLASLSGNANLVKILLQYQVGIPHINNHHFPPTTRANICQETSSASTTRTQHSEMML